MLQDGLSELPVCPASLPSVLASLYLSKLQTGPGLYPGSIVRACASPLAWLVVTITSRTRVNLLASAMDIGWKVDIIAGVACYTRWTTDCITPTVRLGPHFNFLAGCRTVCRTAATGSCSKPLLQCR